jgi:hypothetical protein
MDAQNARIHAFAHQLRLRAVKLVANQLTGSPNEYSMFLLTYCTST